MHGELWFNYPKSKFQSAEGESNWGKGMAKRGTRKPKADPQAQPYEHKGTEALLRPEIGLPPRRLTLA